MGTTRNLRAHFDWPLFGAVAALAVIGVTNLYSATSAAGPARAEIYVTQLYWLTFGAVVAVLVVAIDYRHFERQAWAIYGGGIVLLVLVFLLGREIRGSQRWIPIGSFGLQPSELVKLGIIVALGKYMQGQSRTNARPIRDILVPPLIAIPPIWLTLKQPDLGTALILMAISGTVVVSQIRLPSFGAFRFRSFVLSLVALLGLGSLAAGAGFFAWNHLLHDYQRERVLSFIDPEHDRLDTGWHAYQSTVAIGNGGFAGRGFLQGTQNQFHFIPDQDTDFPFPVWAEEWGFLGVTAVLAVYLFIVLWSLRVAAQAKDRFGSVVAIGVGAMFFWQSVINIGMVMGLLPVVGVTLPLVSYGGSSVLTIMAGVGLLMNVSIRRFSF